MADDVGPLWSADMLVVEYTDVSIGAASADLFSNVGGSAGLKVKSLWSYKPGRDLRLLLEGDDLDPEGLKLQVGGLRLPFPAGSSTGISFKWTDVDVDWEDGQTLAARIGRNTLATGAPSISGTVQVGETLTAHTTGIADADGLDGATFGYQWVSNDGNADSDIQDATDSTYTLVLADEGKTVKVRVSFTDRGGFAESCTSTATMAVAPPTNTQATGAPKISGTTRVRETLAASTSEIQDENGLDGVTFSYQWIRNHETTETEIAGATDSTYILVPADEGKTIKVQVSFTDRHGFPETRTSDATTRVGPPPAAPSLPLNLEVSNDENRTLAPSWDAPASDGGSAITGYKVRWRSGNEEYHPSREAVASGLSYTIRELTDGGMEYAVQVVAVNTVGESEGTEVTATTRDTDPPQLLTARLVNNVTVTLTYDEQLDATSAPATSAFSVLFNSDPSGSPAREVSEVAVFGNTVRLTLTWRVGPDTVVSYSVPQDTGEQHVQDRAGNDAPSFDDELVANHLPADDHGDTPENATVLAPDAFPTRGEIKPHEDVDYFRIEVGPEEAGYISILFRETIIPRSFHSYAGMKLFDSDGNCATRGCDRWSYKKNFHVLLEEGVYYLRVTGLNTLVINENPDRLDYIVQWEPTFTEWIRECDAKQDRFDDPLYGCQNTLNNLEHPGEDINVEPAWASGALGQGIKIVVVDTGIDDLHQDLAGAVDIEESVPTRSGRFYQPRWEHGTPIAGIIAARHNLTGIRGIAPAATLLNYVGNSDAFSGVPNDIFEASTHHHEQVAVSNNSWISSGPEKNGMPREMLWELQEGIEKGIEDGFGGKGISYVFGTANERINSNLFGNLTHHVVIPVCGVNDAGRAYNYWDYASGYGSTLWVCAPYENLTTRRNHTYGTVRGTSLSTAVVSGVTALVRGANKSLTWREVKLILAGSARQNDPSHPEWTAGALKYGSDTKRYHYNEYYGFGVVDAGAAVDLARSWTNLPTMKTVSAGSERTNLTIPDPEDGAAATTLSDTIALGTRVGFTEFVEINIEFDHPSFRDLGVEIVSPSGTVSMLSEPDESRRNQPFSERYRFASAKHLGEDPTGTWTLKVTDHFPGEEEVIRGWDIKIYGHGNGTARTVNPRIVGRARVGETLTADTSAIADGLTNAAFTYQWIRNDETENTNIPDATGASYTPVKADVGKTLKVQVSFTDNADNVQTLSSAATATVASAVPTEPLNLAVARGSQIQELDASWQAPASDGGSDITGYRVQWKEAAGSWDTAADVSEAVVAGTTHTITGLTGGAEYAVRVVAINDVGDGPPSSEATGTPAGGASEQNTEPENADPTGLPAIYSKPQVGRPLRADTSGIADDDGLTNAVFHYQWITNDGTADAEIPGAAGVFYTPTAADVGKAVKVTVGFTDDEGNPETLTSAPTVDVVMPPLTANSSEPAQHDGQTAFTFTLWFSEEFQLSYLTLRDHAFTVEGGTVTRAKRQQKPSNMLWTIHVQPEGNASVTVVLPATVDCDAEGAICTGDGRPLSNRLEFTVAGPVEPASNSAATGLPTITGTVRVGETLTADVTSIADDDGLTNPGFTYQWVRIDGGVDTNIQGATAPTYTLAGEDEGKTLTVRVSFTDDAGNQESLPSNPTGEVDAKPNSAATGLPTITGTVRVGETLTADVTSIADEDGLTNPGFTYQWVRIDGGVDTNIQGATVPTYTLAGEDEGKTLTVTVSFTDGEGNPETLSSDPTGAVEAKPNTRATGAPAIDGIARVGETLTADTSGIDDDDGLDSAAFAYQWTRNDGSGDTNITGATGATYTLTGDDEGKTIKVTVSFTDGEGNPETLTSDPSGAVEAAETVPGRPQDLEGEASAQGIALTWQAPSGSSVTQYVVYRGKLQSGSMNGRPITKYATIDATGADMAYTDGGVEAGAEYRYRVAAVNSAGEGKKSTWLDIEAVNSE